MNAQTLENINYLDGDDLIGFKELTDQLMANLQKGDFESAMRCINEINQINDENLFRIIGKITRGLHNAIADLKVSSTNTEDKSRTKAGLGYVIDVTADAAKTTLDMTEKSRDSLIKIGENLEQENELLARLRQKGADDPEFSATLGELATLLKNNRATVDEISSNVMEIIIAQNYQDLASQSITKSINNIRGVESSLIALTKHTNLLKQISQFTSNPERLKEIQSEELCNSIEQLELKKENEHMDQDDVDNLLSSLGF